MKSKEIREKTIKFSCFTKAGHLAPSLSTVELLTVLFKDYLKFDKNNPKNEKRDRFILSKGHGCYAYYIILNELGIISDNDLYKFNTDESLLGGCVVENENLMLEASTGSLGHGLPIAVGMAKSFKIQNLPNKVICMVGDGEMQEGSNYEALNFAFKHKLDNLLVIIDANKLQAMDYVENVSLDNDTLKRLLNVYTQSFYEIDGHNEDEISEAYNNFFYKKNKNFSIIFAHTIKGKGLEFIENQAKYHYRCPIEDGYNVSE